MTRRELDREMIREARCLPLELPRIYGVRCI